MNGNDERSVVPDADRLIGSQGSNVASSRSTIKIDSLCIKLGIVKEKGDHAQKCRHFSIRGYVAGMRERGTSSNLLPLIEQLPPMDIPKFRYWLCQGCLQNDGTENASNETPLPSVCGECLVKPSARSCAPQSFDGKMVLPSGEGTSGLKPDYNKNDGDESILPALGADRSQSYQEIPAKVKVSEVQTKHYIIDTNAGAPESNELRDHEDPQNTNIVKETIASLVSQPINPGQQNDCQNGNPRRKARKVRLLKELLCANTESQQQRKIISSPVAASSQIKRKTVHDHVNYDCDHRSVDGKKAKAFKGNAIAKNSVVEHYRPPEASEGGETINKYQWNKHGTQRSSTHGKVGGDAMTAWRSIFSDTGRTDNQVMNNYGISKGRGTEPYSNFMTPPKSDKKVNASKKISSNPLKPKIFAEDSRRMKDRQSGAELGLGLSLNYDPQCQVQSQPCVLNRPPSHDYTRKIGFFLGESSNIIAHRIQSADAKPTEGLIYDVGNRHAPRTEVLQEKRPYTQLPYGNCSGHQKLDFSDPHMTNIGVRGYSDITRPHNHPRQEKMFSIGRSDEREIIELMAKNQYERSLCEARSHFAPAGSNNNGIIPNTTGFHNKVNIYEGIPSSNPEYVSMIRPSSPFSTNENERPTTMRNPAAAFFHQDQVSSFSMFDSLTQSQKQPSKGNWISDSGLQRHYDSRYHHASKGNNIIPQTHLYNSTNMHVVEAYSNKYYSGTQQNDAFSTRSPFGETYAKYSEKDKGKNMMDLDLNVVAPSVVEEQNNLESLDLNPKHMSCLDSSNSNEAIPAMQLLSLMDAGKSGQPFSMNSRKFITKPISPCYSHCSSTLTEKTNPLVNPRFPYSGLRPGVQNPTGSSFSSAVWTGQNVKLTSGHGQQIYHKPPEGKSGGTSLGSVSHGCRPEDSSYVFPLPRHASEDGSKLANKMSRPRYDDSLRSEICTMNLNPADFSTPGPENVYMIGVEDLIYNEEICYYKGNSASENAYGPKKQKQILKPTS